MRQTLAMRQESDAIDGDNNGFVNIPLSARDVEAVIYMREIGPDSYRVSLRSKGDLNVAKIAERFGGGGHRNAAGLQIDGDWDSVERMLVGTIREVLEMSDSD